MASKELLSFIYEHITQENPPSSEYMELQEEFSKERELFLLKIGEQNRGELEHLTNFIYNMGKELEKQSFIEGFSTSFRLLIEIANTN